MDRKKPKIITIASIKGGVGKSTSAIIFATLLSENYKVLLIDMDTQSSVTSYFYDNLEDQNLNLTVQNIYEVLIDKININSPIIKINDNLSLLPSYLNLHFFHNDNIAFKELRFKQSLKLLHHVYDYIIIDTSPSLDIILTNALVCSNYIIVPMTAERWSFESLEILEFFLRKLKFNIPIFVLVTRFKKNNTRKNLLVMIKEKVDFLGIVSEREDLNKRIAQNDAFDLNKDYIKEYQTAIYEFFRITEKSNGGG
ncbi:ParA family protein [Borrelia turicatae]|uniref:ParA family protein n=1 Tax=Borrelia turicatae TaxID=142 RepID=UPI002ED16B27